MVNDLVKVVMLCKDKRNMEIIYGRRRKLSSRQILF